MRQAPARPLTIALVSGPGDTLADWQAMAVDRVRQDPRFQIVGRIQGQADRGDPGLSAVARWVLSAERAMVSRRIRPYDTTPAQKALDELPLPDIRGEGTVADLALALGAPALTVEQLARTRLGEWSLAFSGAADPIWVGIRAAAREMPLFPVELTARTAAAPMPVSMRRAEYNPKPGAVLTGAFVGEKSVQFLLKALSDLAEGRFEPAVDAGAQRCDPLGAGMALSYFGSFLRQAVRKLSDERRQRQGRARDYWQLAYGTGTFSDFDPAGAVDIPRTTFVMADPFLFEHDGVTWVFYEAMNADDGAAWIEVARLRDGRLEQPTTALRCPYHLSFPFVFRHGDQVYMMPETQQSQRLEVWRATRFPVEWELHATAFEGQYLADSSLFQGNDGKWWLFTNLSDHSAFQDHSSELYLFSVDGPSLGGVTPHPCNPVVIGSGHARNAGAVFRDGGRLLRPSQNNSCGVYGYGLNIMEILALDETRYEEKLLRSFTPKDRPDCLGMHHLSFLGGRYVIDWSGRERARK